jgi:2-dehydropantoate 2-reductase
VLTGATLAAMCRHPQTRGLVAKMMGEALDIARALGARPSVSIERRLAGAERVRRARLSPGELAPPPTADE